jgi:hypothetical protein
MNFGLWEFIMIILLMGFLIIPLIILIKFIKIEKRIEEIEDKISSSQPEEDW